MRPVHINEVWPKIEKLAQEIILGDSTADEIIDDCLNNRAMCLESEDGIVIVSLSHDARTDQWTLFCWLAVSLSKHGAYERQQPDMDELARELGATKIAFNSKRRGWARKLGDGWVERYTRYEKELKC